MHILMVTEVYYPVVGGAGKVVSSAAEGLVRRGYKVSVLTRKTKGAASRENISGINVYRIAWNSNFIFQLFSFCNIFRFMKRFLSNNLPDLIVFNQPFSAFSAYFVKEVRNLPRIYHFHSSWPEEFQVKRYIQDIKLNSFLNILRFMIFRPFSSVMRCIEQFVVTHFDKIIVASEYSREKLVRFYNLDKNKINIIPGCVDTEKFRPSEDKPNLRSKLGISEDRYVLITARNLVERMGINNLILAFNNLSGLHKDLYLVIVGAGRLKNELVEMTRKLGLNDLIRFTGQLDEPELIKYYQTSDLFVLPTKYIEHFGLVTIEAMAAGIPVLGTPVGGTVEILSKFDNEFLFKGADVDSITEGIKSFLNKYKNVNLKDKCREFVVREYPQDKIVDMIKKLCLETTKK